VLMGMFQNNAGGAWDNAKKSFEKGAEINGQIYYKGSDPHKASVTGDTVGDPFKDTSGPSMNILIKLMSIVSLVIAPTLAVIHHTDANAGAIKEKKIEMKITAENKGDGSEVKISMNGNDPKDELQKLVNALKADKMDDNGNLSVELKNGELIINGKKQPADVLKKYSQYLTEKKDINFSINIKEK
jgi:K(+)-stimulated pyrophosphate-energized sodium pump